MKKGICFFAVLVIPACFLFGCGDDEKTLVSPTGTEKGKLFVTSYPKSGATIYLDSIETEYVTPDTIPNVTEGYHKLRLTLQYFEDWERDSIYVKADTTLHLPCTLLSAVGSIAVISNPAGARIYLDGMDQEKTAPDTLENIGVGKHQISVTLEDYTDWCDSIQVYRDSLTVVNAELTHEMGAISVSSVPSGANIWLDGIILQSTTPTVIDSVLATTHHLRLTKEYYEDWEDEVTVTPSDTVTIEAILQPNFGAIGIDSDPRGANIWLDGQATGKITPDTLDTLAPKIYLVEIKLAGYKTWSDNVTITPGQISDIYAVLIDSCVVGDTTQLPEITITSHPGDCPFGNWADDQITGYVNNISTKECFVALYAETDNFYVQPWTHDKKTPIDCNGTFANGTHCGHHYIAVLARNSWDPPNTMTMLPEISGEILAITRVPERRISFAGHTWIVKSSQSGKIDPGPNHWSDRSENVWVDGEGKLHLRITSDDGEWICAEVYSEESFGYGEYTFYTESRVDQLDPSVVLGLFTYEYLGKEIDIEFARWGDPTGDNAQYVIQPWEIPGNRYTFYAELTSDFSTHRFVWSGNGVEFASWQGHAAGIEDPENVIEHWCYTGTSNPLPGREKARMNLWLVGGQPPTDGQEIEVIVSDFTWREFSGSSFGSIEVSSIPIGAFIWINGENTGFTTPHTFECLLPGPYGLELTWNSHSVWFDSVTVEAGKTTIIDAALQIYGSISISSTPSGAAVWLNGIESGEFTPTVIDTSPGDYELRLTRAEYRDYMEIIEVIPFDTVFVDGVLEHETGSLQINSIPPGANIMLDGIPTDSVTPSVFSEIITGWHAVQLDLSGYRTFTDSVKVQAGQTMVISAELMSIYGTLNISSVPDSASIWLSGLNTGFITPHYFGSLLPGDYEIGLKLEAYKDTSLHVAVVAGETTSVYVNLEPAPTILVIDSDPPGAEIWINGDKTGWTTPDTLYGIPSGTYAIRLMLEEHFPNDTTLQIATGHTEILNISMNSTPAFEITYTIADTIFIVGLDGMNPRVFAVDYDSWLSGYISYLGDLEWSPDGANVVYTSLTKPVTIRDSSDALTTQLGGSRSMDFDWSQDGRYVIYGWYYGGIYRYDLAAGEFIKIMDTWCKCYDHCPVYSPADSLIAFIHHEYGTHAYLYFIDSNGGNRRRISNRFATGFDEHTLLSWLNETQLIYKRSGYGIYLFELLPDTATIYIDPKPFILGNISWFRLSRDKQFIAYSSSAIGVYYREISDSTSYYLATFPVLYQYDWSPDNSAIACRTSDGVHWMLLDGTDYHIISNASAGRGTVGVIP